MHFSSLLIWFTTLQIWFTLAAVICAILPQQQMVAFSEETLISHFALPNQHQMANRDFVTSLVVHRLSSDDSASGGNSQKSLEGEHLACEFFIYFY